MKTNKTTDSKSRSKRVTERIVKRIDQTSGGKQGICEKCGKAFDQVWREEYGNYTQFKMCGQCRMEKARGVSKAIIPYAPHPGQQLVHASPARFRLLAAGARWGKDRCMIMEFIDQFSKMLSEDRGDDMVPKVHGWIIAPTFTLARQTWRELKAYFPRSWIVNIWESDRMIETVNDGIIEVRSADDPNMLVGVGIDIVLITEAARIPKLDEVWANIETRLMSPGRGPGGQGGIGLINSTPRGRTWYYSMFKWGQKDDPDYDPDWESWQFPSFNNPYLSSKDVKYLERMRNRYPDRIYQQEICVTPETIIYGETPKRADEVREGDLLYSHTGKLRPVNKTMVTHYNGELIGIASYKSDGILKITPEHRVLTYRSQRSHRYQETFEPKWMPAGQLQKGDFIAYPDLLEESNTGVKRLMVADFAKHPFLRTNDGRIYYKPKWTTSNPVLRDNPKKTVLESVSLNKKVLRLIGLWLAEGHIGNSGRSVCWSFSPKEINLANEIVDTLKTEFQLGASVNDVNRSISVITTNVFLADVMKGLCGSLAGGKKLHPLLFSLNNEQITYFLSGYFDGDGHLGAKKANCVTVSRRLSQDIRFLLMRLGIESNTHYKKAGEAVINGRKYKTKKLYQIQIYGASLQRLVFLLFNKNRPTWFKYDHTWQANGYKWLRIKKLCFIPYSGPVYNFEVDIDNTYLTENGTVHNCAKFLAEGNSVFPSADLCATYDGPQEPIPGETYVIGWDPAQSVDFSGVAIRNRQGQCVKIEQWRKPWDLQIEEIAYLARYYNHAHVVMDRTGIGGTIPIELDKRGVSVEGVYISNREKEDMVNNLALLIERKAICYPKFDVLINELLDFEYVITKSGTIKYSASTKRKHDDLVTALYLCFKDFANAEMELPFVGMLGGIGRKRKIG